MTKLVTLEIGDGDFENGFKVTVRIGKEGEHPSVAFSSGRLPAAPTLPACYQRWQNRYLELDKRLRGRAIRASAGDTEQLIIQCKDSATQFKETFKSWLMNSQDTKFQFIRERLCQHLGDQHTEIRVLIQTENTQLKKLPWHEWDLFADRYTQAEVALGATEFEKPIFPSTSNQLRILAILGNSEGIDIETDRQTLEQQLAQQVHIKFVVEPNRKEISDDLWKDNWNILFFAGHSSSQGETGQIFINSTDILTVEELKYGLRQAIKRGLQLAIFNSCDGLKLAEDLIKLNLPQVIFMREPVIDKVAHAFLKCFIEQFSKESLYLAVRHARERLSESEEEFDKNFPGARWLPVIYQNPAVVPPSWEQLKLPKSENRQFEATHYSGKGYQGGPANQPHQRQHNVIDSYSLPSQVVDDERASNDKSRPPKELLKLLEDVRVALEKGNKSLALASINELKKKLKNTPKQIVSSVAVKDKQYLTICVIEAIILFELDSPCDSCVWRVPLPNYKPRLDENDPLERGIQKVFQETPADVAKAAIDEGVQMTEQGATSAEIDQVLKKSLNRSARGALKNVLKSVREEPTQLENVKAITLARWQNMKAIAEAVNQRLLECQKQVERETGKRPNLSECLCLLILRVRIELGLNYNAIGAIIGETEQATRQKASRCIREKMRPYFQNCREFIE